MTIEKENIDSKLKDIFINSYLTINKILYLI